MLNMFDKFKSLAIAAALVATIVISLCMLPSCEGRKMSNMTPDCETVEVVIESDSVANVNAAL